MDSLLNFRELITRAVKYLVEGIMVAIAEVDFVIVSSSPTPSIEKPSTSKPQHKLETDAGENILI